MDGEEDRDQQNAQRQGEDSALPEVARFPQSGEADSKNEEDDHKAAILNRNRLIAQSP